LQRSICTHELREEDDRRSKKEVLQECGGGETKVGEATRGAIARGMTPAAVPSKSKRSSQKKT
jgi:hypothetical protein